MSAERTIAQNLELLAQTKASIMNAINAKGGDITSSTPFSAYSAAIAALDVNVYSIEVLDIISYEEQETLENNTNYEARLINNGNQVNEPMNGSWSFTFMPTDYDGTDYSSNIGGNDDQSGQVDNTFNFYALPDGELTIAYYDSNSNELASVTLPVVSESQYRLEIYDDLGKEYGQLVDEYALTTGNNYYVYVYDIQNARYLTIDDGSGIEEWQLTTDDDGTLIHEISQGYNQHMDDSWLISTNFSDGGTTTIYATDPNDTSIILASLEITITDA